MSDELVTIDVDWPAPAHVKVISTTRVGGYSHAPYSSFNLADHCGDNLADVGKNREKLREYFNLPSEPVWLNQVHGNRVLSLNDNLSAVDVNADASWTGRKDTVCAVLTADCLPVYMCDRKGSVVAIAHAGWKGLLNGVISETVKILNVDANQLLVWLGPAIGPQAFKVGSDVFDLFTSKNSDYAPSFESIEKNRWHCDLYQLARTELSQLGVERVYGGNLCTYTDAKKFYSYRRDGSQTGRQAHLIWLENE